MATGTTRAAQPAHSPLASAAGRDRALRVLEKGPRARWWRRRGTKATGFWYEDAHGERITDTATIARLKRLAIPPGYSEVRVSPSPRSRLQAIALDANGRIQYRYNPSFAACQARKKYHKIEEFGRLLPRLRERTNTDIGEDGLGKQRVLAVVLRLINETYFRVGTEGSVRRYHTFGITSLRNHHLSILEDDRLLFQFVGKHHIKQRHVLVDAELAALMRDIKAMPGSHLFSYRDQDGSHHRVTPADVNRYIKEAIGAGYSAKDFRTWGGTLQAAIALAELGPAATEREAKKNIVRATRRVAERLGNTPAVCRDCYIHPIVFERYRQGITLRDFRPAAERVVRRHNAGYELEEVEMLKLFEAQPDCSKPPRI
jgi:DNA topoisomerase I